MNQKPFQQAERDFFLLKGQLATNRLTRAQFDAALQKLNVRDAYGRAWRIEPETGAWEIQQNNAWIRADPKTFPAPVHVQSKTVAGANNAAVFIVLGVILFFCVCGIAAFILLNATGVVTTQLNLFRGATPTSVAFASPTPAAPTVTVLPPQSATLTPDATATPPDKPLDGTAQPTITIPETYLAFDADFFANACPLFEGSNEIREYTCTLGEYTMQHKQATTRYTFAGGEYTDAVVQARGHFNGGSGKYEYGIVLRGNTDGTAYYVFTVTNDGKYNVSLYQNEKYTDLIPYTTSPIVNTGTKANTFKAILFGKQMIFYLNDQFVGIVPDNVLERGVIGLFLYNDEPGAQVAFDQLTISTFTPPTPTATRDANTTPAPTFSPDKLIFSDDFSGDCNLFGGENETRAYGCQNGEYVMRHKQDAERWSVYASEFDDGVFEADGHFVSGSGSYEYGLLIRARDNPWTFYAFTVTEDGKYAVFVNNGSDYTDLLPYTASSAVKTGSAVNHFRVIAHGDTLEFYLNNQFLNRVTDPTLRGGSLGFYLANAQPNVQVAFDNVRISTLGQPQATPTLTSAAPTVVVKPGVYVNNLRFTPRAPKRGEPVTFFATFVNSTGKPQNYRWLVEIWEQDANKRNPYGQADGLQQSIVVGTKELATGASWKVAGGGPCLPFRARVVYEDDQKRRIPFKQTNGAELWVSFQVCP